MFNQQKTKILFVLFILFSVSCNTIDDKIEPTPLFEKEVTKFSQIQSDTANYEDAVVIQSEPKTCPDGRVWDPNTRKCVDDNGGINCSAVESSNLDASQRNRAVALYGQDGGNKYDQIKYDFSSTPNQTYIENYSQLVWNYVKQIESAIVNGSNAYASSASSTTQYNASTYLSYLNSYLNPLKNTITNDVNLNEQQRLVLLQAFQAISDNFTQASNLVTDNIDCFPDQANFSNTSGPNGEISASSSFGSLFKKVVNFVATVVVSIVKNTVHFAAAFYVWGQTPEIAILGGAIGAIWGLGRGIYKAITGDLVCVFSCS